MNHRLKQQAGFIMPTLLSFIIAGLIFAGAATTIIFNNFFLVNNNVKSQQAFNIAEAGINYYLWHLSHNGSDYKDGQSTPLTPNAMLGYGPYVHNYIDNDAINEGTYTLYINPQGSGSTVVTVRSIGKVKGSNITRTIQAQIGATSFASYGIVSDQALWFGSTESADGPVHSNQGIRQDGLSSSTVTSANASYVPATSIGGNGSTSHPGVWCDITVTSPANCNTRSKSDWRYPVTAVDFNQVSSSLCSMKKTALTDYSATSSIASQTNACTQVTTTPNGNTPIPRTNAYVPELSVSFSTTKGYLIILNNNSTYDLYKVNSETDRPASANATYSSALGTTLVSTGVALPPSGVIFVEDNVWVLSKPGSSFHGRVTMASGRLATTNNTDIVIAGNLLYSTKNGSDAIGLVAEDSVYIAPYAPATTSGFSSGSFNYEVDGALLAENGSITYGENGNNVSSTYRSNTSACAYGWINPSQTMTFYGSAAIRQTWTWSWLDGSGACGDAVRDPINGYISGFENNTTTYDYNLLYAPPPSYPITSGFNIMQWREVLTKP